MAAERPPEKPESHWRNLRGPDLFKIGDALKEKLGQLRYHIRPTNSGLSLIETKKWQQNQAERDSVGTAPPDPKRFTVEVHGGPDGVHLGGKPISAREMADLLRSAPGYSDGEPVRLLSCRTGAETADGGPNFAQQLSRELGVEVLAPTTDAWVDNYGNMYASKDRATFGTDSSGVPQPSWNEPGQWISFGSDGEQAVHDSPHPPGHQPRWDREGQLGTASRRNLGGFVRRMFGLSSVRDQDSFDPRQEWAAGHSAAQAGGPPPNSGPPPQQGGFAPAPGHNGPPPGQPGYGQGMPPGQPGHGGPPPNQHPGFRQQGGPPPGPNPPPRGAGQPPPMTPQGGAPQQRPGPPPQGNAPPYRPGPPPGQQGPPPNRPAPPPQQGRPVPPPPPQGGYRPAPAQRQPVPPPPPANPNPGSQHAGGHMPPPVGGNPRPDGGFGPPGSDPSGAWQQGSASPGPRPDGGFGPPGSPTFHKPDGQPSTSGSGHTQGNSSSWRGNRRPNRWDDSEWDDDFEPASGHTTPRDHGGESRSGASEGVGNDARQSSTPRPPEPEPPRHDGPGDGGASSGDPNSRPSVGDLIPHEGGAFDEAAIRTQVSNVVNGNYAGFDVRVDQVTVSEGEIFVSGTVSHPTLPGEGGFKRILRRESDGSLVARHEKLAIDPGMRGQGFATAFNKSLESWYEASGVKKITLEANIDVGGYAWARNGYEFADHGEVSDLIRPKLREEIKKEESALRELDMERKILPGHSTKLATLDEEIASKRKAIEEAKGYLRRIERNDIPRAADISQCGRPDTGISANDETADWIGKRVFMGSRWEGEKEVRGYGK